MRLWFQEKMAVGTVGLDSGGCVVRKEETIFEGVAFALAEEMLREAGEMRFVARGVGMLPAIFPGDELVLHRARLRDLQAGDVVLFAQNSQWHLERVREILPGVAQPYLLTQRDAGVGQKEPVFAEELLGRVAFVVRDGVEQVLPRKSSFAQVVMSAAVSHVPGAVRGCLAWHQLQMRIAHLGHEAADSAAGRFTHSI
jgi:hypothetical protein